MTNPSHTARLAGLIAGALLAITIPAVVIAHTELETSTPADASTVESRFEGPVVLTFTETLADGSEADLIGPDGAAVASAAVDGPDATMTFTLTAPLDRGQYEVRWTGVGEDGHVERGTLGFTVAPAPPTPEPTPELAATASASPTAAAETLPPATVEPSVSASPSPSVDGSGASGGGDVILPIIVALLVVGAGGVYLLTRRNRPTLP